MEKTAEIELNFLIDLLQKIKSSDESQDQDLIDRLWIQIFQYSSQKVKQEVKLDLLSKIDLNIQDIRDYLKIDVPIIIDYKFIKDEKIRNQLIIDCLEMGKYKYGKINSKINFEEYCRFAALQIELMVNYFIKHNFQTISEILSFLKTNNAGFDSSKGDYKSIEDINLDIKVFTLVGFLGIGITNSIVLSKIRRLRNDISHRGTLNDDEIIKEYNEKKIKDLSKEYLKSNPELSFLNKKAGIIFFKRDEDWNAVDKALLDFAQKISLNLKFTSLENRELVTP
jgi:hypothetical protein